jgi:acyl-CoA synthetase (AMP-forming)/AMP-acid ligase II
MTMTKAETLAELITNNRGVRRTITYLEAENSERVVDYAELYERALGILFHLQKLGARPGDKLVIYLANNEQFLDAFWAGMLGGIVPVPVALGISDEHKHKLLRIAKKLGPPFIYTDRKTLDRIGAFAGPAGEQPTYDALASRAFVRGLVSGSLFIPNGRRGDILLRAQAGRVLADSRKGIPSTFLFRTGGDQTVRGYPSESLGVQGANGLVGGRRLTA